VAQRIVVKGTDPSSGIEERSQVHGEMTEGHRTKPSTGRRLERESRSEVGTGTN
jgi:hypothetical protein